MVKLKTTFVEDILKNSDEDNKEKNDKHKIPTFVALIFIGLLFGLYGLIYLIDGVLPTPRSIGDEKNYPSEFIAERAQHHLKVLTGIGPRVTGSQENEILAVEYLLNEIAFIRQHANSNQNIEVDVQKVSGSFDFGNGLINAYGNVQNVVVKFHSKSNSKHSLLINAHFDSVPGSAGGSDDGINCVAMLEVLRKLSMSADRFEHNIIFLFNGAEETPVQAAHGFITQHKWAKEVKVVINLEAAGAGGKMMLFQAGPELPWLLKYYKKVPHVNAQVTAEELFINGFIPSGTDFWVFKDFGNAVGLDFAFIRNGYRYHTKFDNFSNIPLGSYQYVGDNVLFLARNLANSPELSNPHGQKTDRVIFYDYMGLFMITYSQTTAIILHSIFTILVFAVAFKTFYDFGLRFNKKSFVYLGMTFAAVLSSWALAGVFIIIIASVVDLFNFSLSWYGNPWILFGLYVIPGFTCAAASIVVLNRFNQYKDLNASAHTQIQALLLLVIWVMVLFICTFLGFRFIYLFLVPVLFQTLAFIIIQVSCLQYSIRPWQFIYVAGTILPNIFLMCIALTAITFFVPICGRTGPGVHTEIAIATFTMLFTMLITSFYTPLVTLVRNPSLLLVILLAVFVIFFAIIFTPLGFPYSGNLDSPAPQRFWIYHMSRKFRNETNEVYKKDGGFFMYNWDRRSISSIKNYVKDVSEAVSVEEDCKKSLLCGFPLGRYGTVEPQKSTTWIPAEEPIVSEPINFKLNSKTAVGNSVIRFDFTASGPDHMEVYISPRKHANLTQISLLPKLSTQPRTWDDRPLYVIIYAWGKENTPLTFTIDLEVLDDRTEPTLDIGLVGLYLHDRINIKTQHYSQFLKEFPNWTDVMGWLGVYESWVY